MVTNADPDVDPIVSVFIEGPDKKIIFTKLKRSLGTFSLTTKVKGEHKVIFSNIRSPHTKDVIFALHIEEEEILEK